jgi:hypothetical protein
MQMSCWGKNGAKCQGLRKSREAKHGLHYRNMYVQVRCPVQRSGRRRHKMPSCCICKNTCLDHSRSLVASSRGDFTDTSSYRYRYGSYD